MIVFTRLPVEVTVQPPARKVAAAVSASPVLSVLLSTISATPLVELVEAGVVEAAVDCVTAVAADVGDVLGATELDFEVDAAGAGEVADVCEDSATGESERNAA
jgi:tetrahydromethanopterin S-methyltransferase subunit E